MSWFNVGWTGVGLPVLGALISVWAPVPWLRSIGAVVGTLLLMLCALVLFHGPGLGLGALSAWFFVPTCAIGGLGLWQSLSYLAAQEPSSAQSGTSLLRIHPERRYLILYFLFIACIALVTVAPDLLVMWAAVEATTLSSVLLVAHEGTGQAVEAAWKYISVTAVGGLVALFGTLAILAGTHASAAVAPGDVLPVLHLSILSRHLTLIGIAFAVIGFGTKAGLSPMYTWLPDAHSQAPAPVSGLLSGIELSVALYAMLRVLHLASEAVGDYWPTHLLLALGLASVLTAAAFIVAQRDIKRLFAYSTVEHMGLIVLGLGIGGWAVWGALLHVWTHAAAKSLAFFGSGNVKEHYGTANLSSLRNLRGVLPWTTGLLGVSVWALVGLPPLGPFVSEWLILTGAIGRSGLDVGVAIITAALLALVLIGFSRRLVGRLLDRGPEGTGVSVPVAPGLEQAVQIWPIGILAACTVVSGFAGLDILRIWLPHISTIMGGGMIP